MNLFRLCLRPHLLEEALKVFELLELEDLTIRQVKGLQSVTVADQQMYQGNSNGNQQLPMSVEIDLYLNDESIGRFIEILTREFGEIRENDARIIRLHCESVTNSRIDLQNSA